MKKIIASSLVLLSIFAALLIGWQAGRNHAIYDCMLFVVDLPDRNSFGGFDEDEITVYIELDGNIHEYGCNIS